MSELEAYYREMELKGWANPDASKCACGGRGWVLSDLDTWHSCPHHKGPHPEEGWEEDWEEDDPAGLNRQ